MPPVDLQPGVPHAFFDGTLDNHQPGNGRGQFNLPHALIVDRCDRIWVADTLNRHVQVIGSDGMYHGALTSFGDLGVCALAFGASFSSPPETILFVGASPTSGGGTGTVSLFAAPMDLHAARRRKPDGLRDLQCSDSTLYVDDTFTR